jgi:hypothetical protein
MPRLAPWEVPRRDPGEPRVLHELPWRPFALLPEEAAALEAIDDEGGRPEHLQNEIEVRYFESARDYLAQSDKSWDAMHRTLADGELAWEGGDYPLNHTVLAGRLLYTGDDYIMSLKTPAQMKDVAAALV